MVIQLSRSAIPGNQNSSQCNQHIGTVEAKHRQVAGQKKMNICDIDRQELNYLAFCEDPFIKGQGILLKHVPQRLLLMTLRWCTGHEVLVAGEGYCRLRGWLVGNGFTVTGTFDTLDVETLGKPWEFSCCCLNLAQTHLDSSVIV